MSWDQDHPVYSFNYPSGEPQTPSRTPTSTALCDSAFQTPKLESSFFDPRITWDTSDPYASSPECLRTPQRFNWASIRSVADESPGMKSKLSRQTDPVKRPRSRGPRMVESIKPTTSIQTPPPSSASRSKMSDVERTNDLQDKLSVSNAPTGHLETPSRLMDASPRLLVNLQSSPDLFQLVSMDPPASPSLSRQKLLSDRAASQPGDYADLPDPSMDPFRSNTADDFHTTHISIQSPCRSRLPAVGEPMGLAELNDGRFGLSPATDAALFPAPFFTSPRALVPKAEDPSMFLSSPARRFGGSQLSPEKERFSKPHRQPYHHQTEEFKREELLRIQSKRQQRLGSYLEGEKNGDSYRYRQRPGLTRSLTHTAVTRPSYRPGSSPADLVSSAAGIRRSSPGGRSSPVKTLRSLLPRSSSIPLGLPAPSQSLVLKIGKDGRAKTEMQTVPESPTGLTDPIAGLDFRSSVTERERDALKGSEHPPFHKRNPSFASSHTGRINSDHSETESRPHSKDSHISSIVSSHPERLSPWSTRSHGDLDRPYRSTSFNDWRTPRRRSTLVNSDLTNTSASTAAESPTGDDEGTGDAQHALRQILENKCSRPYALTYGSQSSQAVRSLPYLCSSPPRLYPHLREVKTSQTPVELSTPTTERHSNPSNGTRCVCNSIDNGGHLMIQCESCHHWLHTRCVGLERSNLPSVYVCVFCLQTPRGGQIVMGPEHIPTSPLAHKSYRCR